MLSSGGGVLAETDEALERLDPDLPCDLQDLGDQDTEVENETQM